MSADVQETSIRWFEWQSPAARELSWKSVRSHAVHSTSRVGNETSDLIMQHSALFLIEPAIICILNSSIRQQLQNAVITRSKTAPSVRSQLINQLWPTLGYQRNYFHASPWSRQDHRFERRLEAMNRPCDLRKMRKSRKQTKFRVCDLELRVHETTSSFREKRRSMLSQMTRQTAEWLAKGSFW